MTRSISTAASSIRYHVTLTHLHYAHKQQQKTNEKPNSIQLTRWCYWSIFQRADNNAKSTPGKVFMRFLIDANVSLFPGEVRIKLLLMHSIFIEARMVCDVSQGFETDFPLAFTNEWNVTSNGYEKSGKYKWIDA